jgi:hypothetical protein
MCYDWAANLKRYNPIRKSSLISKNGYVFLENTVSIWSFSYVVLL